MATIPPVGTGSISTLRPQVPQVARKDQETQGGREDQAQVKSGASTQGAPPFPASKGTPVGGNLDVMA
jgi:hypothetical protein